jgi:hypothetical protein
MTELRKYLPHAVPRSTLSPSKGRISQWLSIA